MSSFWSWLLPLLQTLVWPALGLLALGLAARVFTAKTDSTLGPDLKRWTRTAGKVAALLLITGLFATVHRAGMQAVAEYRKHQSVKRFDSKEVVAGSAVNQNMPTVQLKRQKLVDAVAFQPDAERESYSAAEYLQNQGMSGAEIVKTTPTVKGGLRINYRYPRWEEQSVSLTNSQVNLKLDPVADADPRANSYELKFEGTYEWSNETDSRATTTFGFSLPDHGGTIESVSVSFDGIKATGSNDNGSIFYTAELAAGAKATAKVTYRTKGRGNFRFYPSNGLRTIRKLDINLESTADVRFERGSIVAKSLGGGRYSWSLTDAVTRQYISIAIPYARGTQELWWKLGYLTPFALLAFTIVLMLTDCFQRDVRVLVGCLLAQAGCLAIPIGFTNFDVSPTLLGVISVVLGATTTVAIIGPKCLPAVIVSSCIVLAAVAGPISAGVVFLVMLGLGIYLGRTKVSE